MSVVFVHACKGCYANASALASRQRLDYVDSRLTSVAGHVRQFTSRIAVRNAKELAKLRGILGDTANPSDKITFFQCTASSQRHRLHIDRRVRLLVTD
ncbi:hypothetical protein EVAR_67224_1 [Eumeta japonica]|uniref:Uncharacterized protein n=1 Tax=Eumeta variegata TaxID=151549 RepID=A0A4C2A3E7_EUMVA|nr:hypothetical protein EVAR_67224_1 [Eumeta japonica]